MKYALNLAEDNRILSAWKVLPNGNYPDMPIVEALPKGDITDYLYDGGEFVYDPKPVPVPVEDNPTADDVLNALLGVTE